MEKSKVYFTKEITSESLVKIYNKLGIELKEPVAVKLHSGEEGNQNYLGPELMKDIIADVGPDGFLKVEDRVNAQVKAERTVISPGGSVVYCENAMKHYKEIGKVVYLQASFETINSRLKNAKGRGVVLRDGQTLKDLYDERVKLFEKYADITVCEDNQKLEDTIESVLDALGE